MRSTYSFILNAANSWQSNRAFYISNHKEVRYMFARFLEFTVKPDKKPEFVKAMKEEILPILKMYKGFFDLVPLEVETEFTKFYVFSLWHEKAEMEKYAKEHFPKVKAIVEPFLTAPIIVKHCTVDETISKKFVAAVAA